MQYQDVGDKFNFLSGGTPVMTIDLGMQRVGVGTGDPAYVLDVNGRSRIRGSTSGNSAGFWYSLGIADRAFIGLYDSQNHVGMYGHDGAGWHFLMHTGTGNVTVGPNLIETAKLNVNTNGTLASATLRLHENEADSARLDFTNTNTARKWQIAGFIGPAVADDRLNFWNTSGAEVLSLTGDGRAGIGTTVPAYKLHVSTSTTERAIYGHHTAASGTTYGVYGQSDSDIGRGVYGQSNGPYGIGVYGLATATSGLAYGVLGRSVSINGVGVVGLAYVSTGAAWGVFGGSLSFSSTAVGVYGQERSGGAGHAVYAEGSLAASGTKSFQIDHPLRPETHYLNHFCTEGAEPLNAYSGVVILDTKGEAWVQLPAYFEAINRDPRYTLTPIGAAMPNLHVAVEIRGNRFKIAGGVPGRKVSWRVEAIRNDLYVQRYGYLTEQEKEDEIKGKYLQPELYGQPKERGIHDRPEPERPSEVEKPR
jgi:hypothetical protein